MGKFEALTGDQAFATAMRQINPDVVAAYPITPQTETVEITQLAVDTCYWPLYEVEDGQWRLTYKPREKVQVEEWLKRQGRFRHLFRSENRPLIHEFQADVDRRWEQLLRLCGEA